MTGDYVPKSELIEEAIDSYAARAGSGDGAAPYSSESLAEIYAPRVKELLDVQAQGYEYAVWKWDEQLGENHWHGVGRATNPFLTFLARLAPYKTEQSSVLHVFVSPVQWPDDPGSVVLLIREDHWFGPPTFNRLFVAAPTPVPGRTLVGH